MQSIIFSDSITCHMGAEIRENTTELTKQFYFASYSPLYNLSGAGLVMRKSIY